MLIGDWPSLDLFRLTPVAFAPQLPVSTRAVAPAIVTREFLLSALS